MLFFRLLEIVSIVLLLGITVTQIVIPVVKGQKMFPIFRKQGKLEDEVVDEQQKAVERKLQTKIKTMKKGN